MMFSKGYFTLTHDYREELREAFTKTCFQFHFCDAFPQNAH